MSVTALSVDDFDDDAGGLTFWHPVDDVALTEAYLPGAAGGTVAPGSSADARVRVKNTAEGYTAATVTVAVAAPTDPSAVDGTAMVLLSVDGDTFTATAALGDLAAGQVSDPVTVRRVTAPDAAAAHYGYTLTATAASWPPATAGATTATTTGNAYDPDAAAPVLEDPEEQM